ncbi:MAG TPA: hypothetical protein VIS10_05555, partial [Anaerolineales bacterium]
AELRAALEQASPRKVYLFGLPPDAQRLDAFLQRLSGLLKYALKGSQGRVSIPVLAAATGQREISVRLGLAWLEAGGHIVVTAHEGDEMVISLGQGSSSDQLGDRTARLKALIDETAAYRAFFKRADKESLL